MSYPDKCESCDFEFPPNWAEGGRICKFCRISLDVNNMKDVSESTKRMIASSRLLNTLLAEVNCRMARILWEITGREESDYEGE